MNSPVYGRSLAAQRESDAPARQALEQTADAASRFLGLGRDPDDCQCDAIAGEMPV